MIITVILIVLLLLILIVIIPDTAKPNYDFDRFWQADGQLSYTSTLTYCIPCQILDFFLVKVLFSYISKFQERCQNPWNGFW